MIKSNRKILDLPSEEEGVYKDQIHLPVLGKIAAGVPIDAIEDISDTIAVDADLLRGTKGFVLQAIGFSMIEANINDGDLVVFKQQNTAENGRIVAAMVEGEVTMKYFYNEGSRICLEPGNRNMHPIYVDDGQFEILGVALEVRRGLSLKKRFSQLTPADRNARLVNLSQPSQEKTASYSILQIGDSWRVVFEGKEVLVRDSMGMKYLAFLLTNPATVLTASELRNVIYCHDCVKCGGMEITDYKTIEECKKRISEIADELENHRLNNDLSCRIEKLYREKEELLEYINASKSICGGIRRVQSKAERDRSALKMALNRAIDSFENIHEKLYSHLKITIVTGSIIFYNPSTKIIWENS